MPSPSASSKAAIKFSGNSHMMRPRKIASPDALPKGLAAVRLLGEIKDGFSVSANGSSSIRGNRAVLVYHGAPGVTTGELIGEAIHKHMRRLVNGLALLVDDTCFPTELQRLNHLLKRHKKTYATQGAALGRMYERSCGTPDNPKKDRDCQKYSDLEQLRGLLKGEGMVNDSRYRAINNHLNTLNRIVAPLLPSIEKELRAIREIPLTGGMTIPNTRDAFSRNDYVDNLAEWLFYARHAAQNFADTTKIPTCLHYRFDPVLGTTRQIVPRIAGHIDRMPELHQPRIFTVFEKAVEDMHAALLRCGSHDELIAAEPWAVYKAGWEDKAGYDAALARRDTCQAEINEKVQAARTQRHQRPEVA